MRMPWNKSDIEQLELVDPVDGDAIESPIDAGATPPRTASHPEELSLDALASDGHPLRVSIDCLEEDPGNPRTEFPDNEIAELAEDVALRGILQPIVVVALAEGRYRVLFGAKRLRAARRAGLKMVPVVIGSQAHDVYAQVAENQKRHGLTPLDLARFMRARLDAGDSNADVARRMGIDLTSVAHYLALLTLPPELDAALRNGRCTSPRTLYELAKLHETKPEQVTAILSGEGEITRRSVASIKKAPRKTRVAVRKAATSTAKKSLVGRANELCKRLEILLGQMTKPGAPVMPEDLAALQGRLTDLTRLQLEGQQRVPVRVGRDGAKGGA